MAWCCGSLAARSSPGNEFVTRAPRRYALDCHMNYNMKSILANSDPIVTFIHQMIPHHQNAVNMAKALLKTNTLDSTDEDDREMENMMWAIICVEINRWVGCTRQFFAKSFLGDDAAVLVPFER